MFRRYGSGVLQSELARAVDHGDDPAPPPERREWRVAPFPPHFSECMYGFFSLLWFRETSSPIDPPSE